MKIGNYTRAVYEYSKAIGITKDELRTLLAISDTMWMGIDQVQYELMVDRRIVIRSLRRLKDVDCIKVSRTESAPKGLCRMYSITQKGRDVVREFINNLK